MRQRIPNPIPDFVKPEMIFLPNKKTDSFWSRIFPRVLDPEWGEMTPAQSKVRDLVLACKAKVRDVNFKRPCYLVVADRILMPEIKKFRSANDYYAILLHELGHWTGHRSRLDRIGKNPDKIEISAKKFQEEMTAQKTAYHFHDKFNLPHRLGREKYVELIGTMATQDHGSYITAKIILRANQESQQAIAYLENLYEKTLV